MVDRILKKLGLMRKSRGPIYNPAASDFTSARLHPEIRSDEFKFSALRIGVLGDRVYIWRDLLTAKGELIHVETWTRNNCWEPREEGADITDRDGVPFFKLVAKEGPADV